MRYFLMHFFVSRNLTLSIILFGQATKEDEMHLLKNFCNLVPGIFGFNSDSLPTSIILPLSFWNSEQKELFSYTTKKSRRKFIKR